MHVILSYIAFRILKTDQIYEWIILVFAGSVRYNLNILDMHLENQIIDFKNI